MRSSESISLPASETKVYDYIIAGAGASGLDLLRQLIGSPPGGKSILVVDGSLRPNTDKTWCYWGRSFAPEFGPDRAWKKLEVRSGEKVWREPLQQQPYSCIRSESWYRNIIAEALKRENIHFLESRILGFSADEKRGYLQTEAGEFSAEWIFQSVRIPDLPTPGSEPRLIQHFTGWEIETEQDFFDPSAAIWMDFYGNPDHGVPFFYLLPFNRRRALVEYTVLSGTVLKPAEYEQQIQEYLQVRFGLTEGQYTICRKENGKIPMDLRKESGWINPRTLNLGIAGGVTKPSTGYTLVRSALHNQEIVNALAEGRNPAPFSGSPWRYRLYDAMLLWLLQNEPENGRKVFHRLFEKNRIGRILQFLDEGTTFAQELAIFVRMPWLPFFRSLYGLRRWIRSEM